jgi:hypothetical protein
MKKFNKFSDVPAGASYIGSSYGDDGTLDENLADYIEDAIQPALYTDADGVTHYFDLYDMETNQ